ncbi:Chemotaxis regulator - transmits chemoreceptor signals to flagelllar motor components CheY [hydrothermal vent metagenome]|uniref:Chemotaxis regulator - transmits chemoreceptor signals to flagelllar motor components CheY n=1 Tax=hydrothermal vent metagenome TaxID=652676 RepID=A0A3B1DTD5_9ZZZZ
MATVLIVDDSSTDRILASGLLKKSGENYDIFNAVDGKDGLKKIELHLPDIIITDMQMPEMNGLEFVRMAKENYPLIPVILMTSQGSEAIAVEALQAGAASYVPKRVLAEDLAETVERVLSTSGKHVQMRRLLNRVKSQEIRLELEMDTTLIAPTVSFMRESATEAHLCDENDQLRLSVALEEALVNAFYHGNLEMNSELREQDHGAYHQLAEKRLTEEPYCHRKVYIEAHLTPHEMIFQIRDEGKGFDLALLPNPTDPANLTRPCGRGILLMKTFMDEINYNETGNQITLIKRHTPHT